MVERQRSATGTVDLTGLLQEWGSGNPQALDRLVNAVYNELHRIARRCLRNERRDISVQSGSIVHEAYLMMRHILVDHARKAQAAKRGGGACRLVLDEERVAAPEKDIELLQLDNALRRLALVDPQQSRIVELRYFAGLSIEATAKALGLSPATVNRDWRVAKAFLYATVTGEQQNA